MPFDGKWNENNTVSYLKDKQGKLLIGWSTGAHIILKHLNSIKYFKNVILISPFRFFLTFTRWKIIDIMIKNFKYDPTKVIRSFLIKAQAPYKHTKFDKNALLEGLNFLKHSSVKEINNTKKLTVIHGKRDRIVPYRESLNITDNHILLEKTGHYVDEKTLIALCNEIVDKKIL